MDSPQEWYDCVCSVIGDEYAIAPCQLFHRYATALATRKGIPPVCETELGAASSSAPRKRSADGQTRPRFFSVAVSHPSLKAPSEDRAALRGRPSMVCVVLPHLSGRFVSAHAFAKGAGRYSPTPPGPLPHAIFSLPLGVSGVNGNVPRANNCPRYEGCAASALFLPSPNRLRRGQE